MNQFTRYILDIYQVSLIVRDTLEYAVQGNQEHNLEAYNRKKAVLKNILDTEGKEAMHPLVKFCSENQEAGTKILSSVKEFYETIYGEDSRAVFVENEKVNVRDGYATQIIDYVVGIHETLTDVLNGFVTFAKEKNELEPELTTLLARDNAYYRSLVALVITDRMHSLFREFNQAMHESKGQPTPQSNFVQNELKKTIGFFKFAEEHANYHDDIYQLAVEKTKNVVDAMGGQRKIDDAALGLKPGEGLRNEILNLHDLWVKNVALTEGVWRNTYQAEVNTLIEYDKARQAAANGTPAPEAAAPATEETPNGDQNN